ncbi:porin [Leptospira langatensis]|uniref:Porin n=1 Tax=Leptospira langatensis TaxID=2484983 RepID=A0A5F1ZVB4_9LEPT|nr:outer membrane beta-barrel protein [Leptospira langatensis]TGK03032.1 porin [Leptospira langatensis]TGL41788.1 porin [Leptospira langatensis]
MKNKFITAILIAIGFSFPVSESEAEENSVSQKPSRVFTQQSPSGGKNSGEGSAEGNGSDKAPKSGSKSPQEKDASSSSQKETQEGEEEEETFSKSEELNPKKKESTVIPVQFGFFVDGYYNASLNRPDSKELAYTTQATRTNEYNINLAYVDGKVETDKYRGRLALQFGTSVVANYVGEGTTGKTSNELSIRNMQEAYGGIKLGKSTWLDAGIYFGHLGYESWISHENFVYTRAFSLDYVPYYVSGFRLSGKITDKLSYQLHLDNGYQVVTDNNKDMSGGFRLEYNPRPNIMLRWNTFMGNEQPTAVPKEMRYYNNFIAEWKPTHSLTLASSFDVAYQHRASSQDLVYTPDASYYVRGDTNAYRQVYVGNIWIAYRFLPDWRIGTRFERYLDRDQMIIVTNTKDGFETGGATATLDYNPDPAVLLRFTYQYRRSMDSIYPYEHNTTSRLDRMFIFSLSLKI